MSTYCEIAPTHPVHRDYHEHEYGFPLKDDDLLFERLVLEINQAGLSWETILKKRARLRAAYDDFHIETVANYGEADVARLLNDAGIIRNRLKIAAAIHNAGVLVGLIAAHGSVDAWLRGHHPRLKADWVKLFKQTFRFTGGEIVGEFLMSIGYLPGAHATTCPVYSRIAGLRPMWEEVALRPAF